MLAISQIDIGNIIVDINTYIINNWVQKCIVGTEDYLLFKEGCDIVSQHPPPPITINKPSVATAESATFCSYR